MRLILYDNTNEVMDHLRDKYNYFIKHTTLLENSGMFLTVGNDQNPAAREFLLLLDIEDGLDWGVLVHELVHASLHLLWVVGIDMVPESEEAMAYFYQFLFNKVIDIIRNNFESDIGGVLEKKLKLDK